MKYFIILFCIIYFGCSSSDLGDTICYDLKENAVWKTIQFKNAHTIQFPDSYEGQGKMSFEGNTFFKERKDKMVSVSYFYCGPLWCDDFGQNIGSNLPKEIKVKDQNGKEVVLGLKIDFCQNGVEEGVFYYDDSDMSTGRYFMKRGKTFYEAATILFHKETLDEVKEIIRTISVAECQEEIFCTEIYVSVTVKIQKENGEIFKPKQLFIKFDKTGDRQPVFQGFPGIFAIVTDGDLGRLKKAGSALTLEGYDENNLQIINEKYVVGHDCCHVKKIEGKDVITIK